MSAAALLREATAAGVTLRLVEGKPRVGGSPSPELLARLRDAKAEVVELLRGDRCRRCGGRLSWPGLAGVTFADGTAECHRCADREVGRILAAAERVVNSRDALADPAELMLRDGGLS